MTMNRTVLLVDDDREMLHNLKESLRGRAESISVLLAGDGIEALQILKHQPISLVVTELKLPRMDGFELLATVTGSYPDIPVIIITGYSTPDMEQLAWQGGAAGFIVKPFPIEHLADPILTLLQKESEGGVLHHISSVTFLQLIEMEQKTCTVRLEDTATGKRGALFFVEGALCDARQGDLNGKSAAYEIFGWDPVSLCIQNESVVRENRIQKDVHLLILEAARRRDENQSPTALSAQRAGSSGEGYQTGQLDLLRNKIEQGMGLRGGIEGLFRDPLWDERIKRLSLHGRKLNLGRLVTGYIDQGDPHGYVMVGGEKPTVIVVSRKCPRDRLMHILSG
jgi:CheY-like chemotaxis protein